MNMSDDNSITPAPRSHKAKPEPTTEDKPLTAAEHRANVMREMAESRANIERLRRENEEYRLMMRKQAQG